MIFSQLFLSRENDLIVIRQKDAFNGNAAVYRSSVCKKQNVNIGGNSGPLSKAIRTTGRQRALMTAATQPVHRKRSTSRNCPRIHDQCITQIPPTSGLKQQIRRLPHGCPHSAEQSTDPDATSIFTVIRVSCCSIDRTFVVHKS
jgi:hypothetical protein